MGTTLSVINASSIPDEDRSALDQNVASLIEAHKNNRQEINRLVFESVAAMTAGDDLERELSRKKG